jgi:hypothetical protein
MGPSVSDPACLLGQIAPSLVLPLDGQAILLRREGFAVERKGKVAKVKNFRESPIRFH